MHSTDNLDDGYKGSGKLLWYSINKHGKKNHEIKILEFLPSRKKLKERETKLINEELINDPLCMNLALGGEGGFVSLAASKKGGRKSGKIHADKIKNNDNYRKENYNRFQGKSLTSFLEKKHSTETKQKMSLSRQGKQKGELNSQFGTCWITNEKENKKIPCGADVPKGYKLGRKL